MQTLLYATSFLAISQLLFMGLFYLLYFRQQIVGLLLALLSFCLISFVLVSVLPLAETHPILNFFLGRPTIAAPAVLWVIAHYLFVDERKISAYMWAVIIGYQVVRTVSYLFLDQSGTPGIVLSQLTFIVMLILSVQVITTAYIGRRHDLVEQRRRFRVPFSLGLGSILAAIVSLSMISVVISPERLDVFMVYATMVSYLAVFVFTLVVNLATFKLVKESPLLMVASDALPMSNPSSEISKYKIDPEILAKITKAMEVDKLYTESKLTIGDLAARIDVQEYKLRRIINQGLGYRNFNQYLNQYRIDEASKRLVSSNESQLPISTIALDAGYASLSSFNKSFKEIKGVTPSAYRISVAADEFTVSTDQVSPTS